LEVKHGSASQGIRKIRFFTGTVKKTKAANLKAITDTDRTIIVTVNK
jgi:hypothetical protein